jgi:hypothetical protein
MEERYGVGATYWLIPAMLATQEVETWRIMVGSLSGQRV